MNSLAVATVQESGVWYGVAPVLESKYLNYMEMPSNCRTNLKNTGKNIQKTNHLYLVSICTFLLKLTGECMFTEVRITRDESFLLLNL